MTAAPDLLGTIVAATQRIIEVRREREPLAALETARDGNVIRRGSVRARRLARPAA